VLVIEVIGLQRHRIGIDILDLDIIGLGIATGGGALLQLLIHHGGAALGPGLLGRLLGAAFRAYRRLLRHVVEFRRTGHAGPFQSKVGLRHAQCLIEGVLPRA
jgi:hypothetical protein